MASDAAAVATEAPSPAHQAPIHPTGSITSPDPARSLKRQREETPPSPNSLASHDFHTLGSPAKSARLALAVGSLPAPLTGAAALEDERRRREAEEAAASPPGSSDNPSHRVLASLLSGANEAMSRPSDAPQPVPTANMEPVSPRQSTSAIMMAAEAAGRAEERADDASPHSANGISGAPVTTSPTPMDMDHRPDDVMGHQVAGQEERTQPSSLSYPGTLQASPSLAEASPRGMSYPMPMHGQTSPTSSGAKKHKCPYCDNEFTRHHNLKSHLLTHSQEKPFVCTQCPLRFRRLHDLKRHGKLHTGEKPHICPKCDRKFARGDALARHTKGAGGCAGRRSSMGSFADGDELGDHTLGDADDSTMSGLYDPGDDDLRRQSMPNAGGPPGEGEGYGAHSRTYPPTIPRSTGSGLYQPSVGQAAEGTSGGSTSVSNSLASNQTPSTSVSSNAPLSGANAGMYSQTDMTESPKPLSPGVAGQDASNVNRQRSPGAPPQQKTERRPSELGGQARAPNLSQPGYTAAPAFGGNGQGSASANDSRNMFAQSDPSMWAYVQGLEDKFKALHDKVESLEQELAGYRAAHEQQQQQQQQQAQAQAQAPREADMLQES